MYTEAYLNTIQAQIRKRTTILFSGIICVAALIIMSVILRMEWMTNAFTIVGISVLIFFFDRCITPLRKYAAHLMNCMKGITHEVEVEFDSFSPDISVVEGVRFYAMNTLEQKGDKQFDRLFYWDAELPKPDYQVGDKLKVTYHDRQIAAIERC